MRNVIKIINKEKEILIDKFELKSNKTNLKITKDTIEKLCEYDICKYSVRKKTLSLIDPIILLDEQKIKKYSENKTVPITILEETTSTNDYIHNLNNLNPIHICVSELQSNGKGQLGRKWHSPFGQNIYLSIRYIIEKNIQQTQNLTLVAGLSVASTIDTLLPKNKTTHLKWPNDILVDGKKISGILVERYSKKNDLPDKKVELIIGVGINVNMINLKSPIIENWTSIRNINLKINDRNKLLSKLIDNLLKDISLYFSIGFTPFKERWINKSSLTNKYVYLKTNKGTIYGKIIGIDIEGKLLIEHEKKTNTINSNILSITTVN